MKTTHSLLFFMAVMTSSIGTLTAQDSPEPILLWPNNELPNGWSIDVEESRTNTDGITRVKDVNEPSIRYYPPASEEPTETAVIICPGGGYHILAIDLEGDEIAEFLAGEGIHAFVLKYRLPRPDEDTRYGPALQDAQRAISTVRSRAEEWKIDPEQIGIMGFSAGGHLAAVTATRSEERHYEAIDAIDQESCRPDFAALIYPGYLVPDKESLEVSPELTVSEKTPPTFIVQTTDDPIPIEGSVGFYLALKEKKVPCELHIFDKGPHGYGMRTKDPVGAWPSLMSKWIHHLTQSQSE